MAVPLRTDPELLRARLTAWLNSRPGGPRGARVPAGAVAATPGSGSVSAGSDDDLRWELGEPGDVGRQGLSAALVQLPAWQVSAATGRRVARPLIVRFAPRDYRLYPWNRFGDECRLVDILARRSDVPVPPVYGYELDPAVLGAPFLVLGLVDGEVPPDIPPYHMSGFPCELAPDGQARVWEAGLAAMAQVHRLDPVALGVQFAGQSEYGPTGFGQQLAAYDRHLDFFAPAPETVPIVAAALDWLRAHPPSERHPPRLLWGDARLGNLIFTGDRVAAVLDWEMMSLGQPETDLAWYLHLDRHLSEGVGLPRLPALPGRAATADRYAALLGRPLADLDTYLLFASVRHTLLAARVTRLMREHALLPPGKVPPIDEYAAHLLTRVLAETRSTH